MSRDKSAWREALPPLVLLLALALLPVWGAGGGAAWAAPGPGDPREARVVFSHHLVTLHFSLATVPELAGSPLVLGTAWYYPNEGVAHRIFAKRKSETLPAQLPELDGWYDEYAWVYEADQALAVQQAPLPPGQEQPTVPVLWLRKSHMILRLDLAPPRRGRPEELLPPAARSLAMRSQPLASFQVVMPLNVDGPQGPLSPHPLAIKYWNLAVDQPARLTLAWDPARPLELVFRFQPDLMRFYVGRAEILKNTMARVCRLLLETQAGPRTVTLKKTGVARLKLAQLHQQKDLTFRVEAAPNAPPGPTVVTRPGIIQLAPLRGAWQPPPVHPPPGPGRDEVLKAGLDYCLGFYNPRQDCFMATRDFNPADRGYLGREHLALAFFAAAAGRAEETGFRGLIRFEFSRLAAGDTAGVWPAAALYYYALTGQEEPLEGVWQAAGGPHLPVERHAPPGVWNLDSALTALDLVSLAAALPNPPAGGPAAGLLAAEWAAKLTAAAHPRDYTLGKGVVTEIVPNPDAGPHAAAALILLRGAAGRPELKAAAKKQLALLLEDHVTPQGQVVPRLPKNVSGPGRLKPWEAYRDWSLTIAALEEGGRVLGDPALTKRAATCRQALFQAWDPQAGGWPVRELGPDGQVRTTAERRLRDQVWALRAFWAPPLPWWPGDQPADDDFTLPPLGERP
ncbi:MAG: hypothetical protein KQJ78_03090 [Deltaproteobacteria bacterium]|nr:hypothetical protein [Deltaproteobacteria bacterium]